MADVLTEQLVAVMQCARQAPHGSKGDIYNRACHELGITMATLQRKLKQLDVMRQRKRRTDAGETALSLDEARLISGLVIECMRKNGKRIQSIEQAVDILRANQAIQAAVVDKAAGELRPLSVSAIVRALRVHKLHPDQLLEPAPVTRLASKHPNHVWQIDASLCVLYYLTRSPKADHNGLRIMDAAEFNDNKPKNLQRIEKDRVWRYAITDHASGVIYVEYVFGGESGENLANVFIHAVQPRTLTLDPFHGVPFAVMLDPGSANTGAVFQNLCKHLQVQVLINKPKNARAKGQVEKANDIIECSFEPSLKLVPVHSLETLNEAAWKWMRWFNGHKVHSRHGRCRYALWQTIKADELRLTPVDMDLRELAHSKPELHPVTPELTVNYRGNAYDVSSVPQVIVGEKLLVATNPWRKDAAQIVLVNEQGQDIFHVVPQIQKNELGFRADAAVIGETFKRHADTPAQTALKDIEQIATGTTSVGEAAAARKAMTQHPGQALPFKGIDPYKPIDNTALPTWLPKRGKALDMGRPQLEVQKLEINAALLRLKNILRHDFDPSIRTWLEGRFPDGVPEDRLDVIAREWMARSTSPAADMTPAPLRLVGGAA